MIKPLGTGEVATYCGVDQITVGNWIREGKLRHYSTAGGIYRIERADLVEFLRQYDMPVAEELLTVDRYRVLVCDNDPVTFELISKRFQGDKNIELDTVADGYTACMKIGSFQPDVLLLDIMIPKVDVVEVCKKIRENQETKSIYIIILIGHNGEEKVPVLKKFGVKIMPKTPAKLADIKTIIYKVLQFPQP